MRVNPLPREYKGYEPFAKIFCGAIDKKQLVQFHYRSGNDKFSTLRIVEPYLVVIDKKGTGNIKLVGFPTNRTPQNGELGHYLFDKLNFEDIVVLDETFNQLQVKRSAVYDTQTVLVICRVDFPAI